MAGPLHGVRIVELSSIVLGPWACQLLADMGADVVKVEAPRGDSNRALGASRTPGMGALYLTCNRNKRSLVLDLTKPGARDALLRLVAKADVFVHNNRPQVMTKLRLDYSDLKKVNPRLIYCGAYGYSKKGPYGNRGALDDSIQAVSGMAMLNIETGAPRYMPTIVADKTTAVTAVYGILAALFHRERTGEGQELEVPMFETMVSFLMAEHQWGMTFEPPLGAPGYTRMMNRRPYKTLDGYIAILPYLDAHWTTFCERAGRRDLLADPRFASLAARLKHIADTYAETEKTIATRTTQEWLDLFSGTSIPTVRVNRLEDLPNDPHLEAVGFWSFVEHPTEGRLRAPAFPVNFGATPADIRRHAPRMGEHTVEVLREAGLSEGEIDALCASGAALTAKQVTRKPGQDEATA